MTTAQEAKIDALIKELSATIAYQKTHAKQLELHAKDIKDLQAYKNKSIGISAAVSLVLSAMGAGIVAIFKH